MNCRKPEVLDLGMNMFGDTFPSWLDTMPNLRVLVLWSNQFLGTISHFVAKFHFLQLRILDISLKKFSVLLEETYFKSMIAIRSENKNEQKLQFLGQGIYYQDSIMVTIKWLAMQLARITPFFSILPNSFVRPIPDAFINLIPLKELNLSNNYLIGAIPSSLSKLLKLEWLGLPSNELDGRIPSKLTQLTYLVILNLSHNYLMEPIPKGNQLNTFPADTYSGNRWSRGFPLSKRCGSFQEPSIMPHQSHDKDSLHSQHVIEFSGLSFLSGVVIGWVLERLVNRKWHNVLERKWSNLSFSCSLHPVQRSKVTGSWTSMISRFGLIRWMLIYCADRAASTSVVVRSDCNFPISVCSGNASGPTNVQVNGVATVTEPYELPYLFWGRLVDTTCTNMENLTVTFGEIDANSNGLSYRVSAENGYNLGIKIMPLGSGCQTVGCTLILDHFPDDLKVRSNSRVIACKPPNCSEAEEQCQTYSSGLLDDSCQKPSSNYEPIGASCDISYDLLIICRCG